MINTQYSSTEKYTEHDYNYYHYSMSAVIKMKAVILGIITMVTEAYMYVMII